ncbi:expressed unknown protein [Seminavis robusta]|uniref:BTB domain-containing protein n=1 Tax=Seminavis robusta TaxID=568900 RepID=A0A9N8DU78_9STRA|nr:expressed unknown protein [Seminavis robusta]|eukprot:Sro360_g126270.1 n/a (423) ;mRNA; f:45404-46672
MADTIMNSNNDTEISRDQMLSGFLNDEALNDVKLKGTDGVVVMANRFLLSARSQVFRGMLLGKFQEASSPVVDIGFQGGILRAIVEYILTDSAQMLDCKKRKSREGNSFDFPFVQSLVSLAEAASYFELFDLAKLAVKKFDVVWTESPCSSFAVLQACKTAGPSIPESLVEKAMEIVRSSPAESITKEHVHCLSSEVLEEILSDKKMEVTEYQLFQILNLWSQDSGDERKLAAAELSKHVCLAEIDPETLSTAVTASGLVTSEQLLETYKQQALEMSKMFRTASLNCFRHKPWVTERPPNGGAPTEINVEGAGCEAVNGVFVRNGSFKGQWKYCKQVLYDGNPCVFWLFSDDSHWVIAIPDKAKPGTVGEDKDFYSIVRQNEEIPPVSGWSSMSEEYKPGPKLKYRFRATSSSTGSGSNSSS